MGYTNPFNRRRGTSAPGLYHWHHGDVFLPGAENVVFEPAFGLPLFRVQGPGIQAGTGLNPLQRSPQVYAVLGNAVAGLGGLVAGQWINQPLNVPDTTNGSE